MSSLQDAPQTVDENVVPGDAPPGYIQVEIPDEGTDVQDDGRIDIDLESNSCKTVLKLLNWPNEKEATQSQELSEFITCDVKLNIVIQVVGSRGDVQPFIALGNELQKHGHHVRLATHNVFDSFVRNAGLEFYPIGGDPADLMAYMVKNPGLIPKMKSLREGDIQRKRKMVAEMLQGCWDSCIEDDPMTKTPFVADAIIANPPSFAHIHCAQALGIPVHMMFTMPWSSTNEYSHPLANLKCASTNFNHANYYSYGIVEWMTWQGLGDVINKFRSSIDLEAIPMTEGPNLAETLKVPFTYCWSPALMPKPADWASHIDVCGFFFRDPPDYNPPSDLAHFLNSGPPPVYIGFGSIVIDDPERLHSVLLEAIQATGVRAIISRGWSNLGGSSSPNVFYLGDCPHEWLFQHVAAVVHHGGAGTTACGLRFGRPTAVVPFFGDQPFWGNMVAASGGGPKPIRYRDLDSRNLTDAIRFCMMSETISAAKGIADKMSTDTGVQTAVQSFHRNLPLDKMRCQLIHDQPAVWTYRKPGTQPLYLSKQAAQILMDHLQFEPKSLQIHEPNPVIIQTRRWDPVTGTMSAYFGMTADMVKGSTNILLKPYKEFNRGRPDSPRSSASRSRRSSSVNEPEGEGSADSMRELPEEAMSKYDPRRNWVTTGNAAYASAKSIGKVVGGYYKAAIVDIPLATTEGLRAVPRLYGEEVKDHGVVRDWKTGAIVGGKNFVHGMSSGLSGMATQVYKGGAKDGPLGVIKGFAKGTIGVATKVPSAALGLVAYPGQGICKSIRAALKSKTRKSIVLARHREGEYLVDLAIDVDRPALVQSFEILMQRNPASRSS